MGYLIGVIMFGGLGVLAVVYCYVVLCGNVCCLGVYLVDLACVGWFECCLVD